MNTPETPATDIAIIAAAVPGKAKKTPAATAANPRTNPYKRGNYARLFDWMMSHKGKPFLVSAMLEFAKTMTDKSGNLLGDQKDENGAPTLNAIRATLAVILGPRKESKRGDPRGNASAEGHIYYVQPVAVDFKEMPEGTSKRDWKKANRKMILRWREPMLEPLYRKDSDGTPMTPKRKAKAEKTTTAKGKAKGKTEKATPPKTGKGKATPAKPAAKPSKTAKPSKAKAEKPSNSSNSFNSTADGYQADAETPETPAKPETPVAAPVETETATA